MAIVVTKFTEELRSINFDPRAGHTTFRKLQNWTTELGTLSTRLGYERFNLGVNSWAPFASMGDIKSIFSTVFQRQEYIIFEADAALHFLHQTSGSGVLVRKIIDWTEAPDDAGRTQYAATQHGVVVVNSKNTPILINLIPLGDASESATNALRCYRHLGFYHAPPAPTIYPVNAKSQIDESVRTQQERATSIAIPVSSDAPGVTGVGLGLAKNGTDGTEPAGDYEYSIFFRLRDGSISPNSQRVKISWRLEPNTYGSYYAVALEIPLGPKDTVSRDIYRTHNHADDAYAKEAREMYLVGTLFENVSTRYWDTIRIASGDVTRLLLPSPTASIALPCLHPSAVAHFSGRLFISGPSEPGTLFYSQPNRVHQFSLDAYMPMPSVGNVLRLVNLDNMLLVVGTRGLGYVVKDGVDSFTAGIIDSGGVRFAPDSVCLVDSTILMLGEDGLYKLEANANRSGINRPEKVSREFSDLFVGNINLSRFNRACAVYDPKKKEYQCYFTKADSAYNNFGIVFHAELGIFSTRTGFPVGCITIDSRGAVIFGHDNADTERGIFVMSGCHTMGGTFVSGEENQMTFVPGAPPTSMFETGYMELPPAKNAQMVRANLTLLCGLHSKQPEADGMVGRARGGRKSLNGLTSFGVASTGVLQSSQISSGYGAGFSYIGAVTLGENGTGYWLENESVEFPYNCTDSFARAKSYVFTTTAPLSLISYNLTVSTNG